MQNWEARLENKIRSSDLGSDPAHDLAHFKRVVATARELAGVERARMEVVLPAAWLHDLVNVPKNDPRRSQASRLSAQAATRWLREEGYPEEFLEEIAHAIEAHSFSARIPCRTLEARIVQDADRLDAIGALGIYRCFAVSVQMGGRLYDPEDPFARGRGLDDRRNAIDHFEAKLFKLVDTLQTPAGRDEGLRRAEFMREFLKQLGREIGIGADAAVFGRNPD